MNSKKFAEYCLIHWGGQTHFSHHVLFMALPTIAKDHIVALERRDRNGIPRVIDSVYPSSVTFEGCTEKTFLREDLDVANRYYAVHPQTNVEYVILQNDTGELELSLE